MTSIYSRSGRHMYEGPGSLRDLAEANRSYLAGAYLAGAYLTRAHLAAAYLARADLTGADLTRANLTGADLTRANLTGADLAGANLTDADLTRADLTRANLRGTVLDPAAPLPALTDEEITSAGLEIRGRFVYGWRTAHSQYVGVTEYVPRRKAYVAPWFSIDTTTACHPGIYLAGRKWLEREYSGIPLVPCRCRRDELVHAGDKWRAKRIWVYGAQK